MNDIVKNAKSLQGAVREIAVENGMKWSPGWSRAYKNRTPGGKVDIKLDGVKIPKNRETRITKALEKAFPTSSGVGVYSSMNTLTIYFAQDPGVGKKINDKAYNMRVGTLSKDIKGLMISSGKSMTEVLKDLKGEL